MDSPQQVWCRTQNNYGLSETGLGSDPKQLWTLQNRSGVGPKTIMDSPKQVGVGPKTIIDSPKQVGGRTQNNLLLWDLEGTLGDTPKDPK